MREKKKKKKKKQNKELCFAIGHVLEQRETFKKKVKRYLKRKHLTVNILSLNSEV